MPQRTFHQSIAPKIYRAALGIVALFEFFLRSKKTSAESPALLLKNISLLKLMLPQQGNAKIAI